MRLTSSLALMLGGFFGGICFVLACGDDSPTRADAADCDCAGLEPRLAGRIQVLDDTSTIAANMAGAASRMCPTGSQLLTGSCTTPTQGFIRNLVLQQSGVYENPLTWTCEFRNNEPAPVDVKATVFCLVPAQ